MLLYGRTTTHCYHIRCKHANALHQCQEIKMSLSISFVLSHVQVHRISKEEAAYKLCIVKKVSVGPKGIPYLTTSDGRTIRYRNAITCLHW